MQSRRRFFCARVELVQLARAFLCHAGQSHSRHAGTMDRATAQPRTDSRPQPPQRAHRATQPGKGTGTQASPETGHRAAHRGRTGASNPQPREQYRRKRSQMPHRAAPGGGAIPILPAAKTPHSGAQSRPQRASRRGYRNAGENKPTAATAPAQHPGRKSGRFSVIFRAIFCDFSRLCPAPGESFIVESR